MAVSLKADAIRQAVEACALGLTKVDGPAEGEKGKVGITKRRDSLLQARSNSGLPFVYD